MCNAGMVDLGNEISLTKDGFELTMAASFYGHFLLTELLLDTLKATAPSRVGILSSVVHAGNPKNRPATHLDDVNFQNRNFNNFVAYGEAKLAVVFFAKEHAERLDSTGATADSIHPGWAQLNFGSGGSALMKDLMAADRLNFMAFNTSDTSEESAQPSLHVLLSNNAPNHNGA